MMNLTKCKPYVMAMSITILSGTALMGIGGCSDDYRVRSAGVYNSSPAYYDPYDYYYYPSSSVYFNISSGSYYYRDGSDWRHARKLPPRYRLDHRDRIKVRVNSDRPYIRHQDHTRQYTPNKDYRRDIKNDRGEREYHSRRYKENQKRKNR